MNEIMRTSKDIIFSALRTSLMGQALEKADFKDIPREQWEELYVQLCRHNIATLVFDVICQLPKELMPPKDIYIKMAVVSDRYIQQYEEKKVVAGNLLKLYNEIGFKTMILKGIGISDYYPIPNRRTFSDLDIYQFGDFEAADKYIADKLNVTIHDNKHHHTTYDYKRILVENHYDFIPVHAHKSSLKFEEILKEESSKDFKTIKISGNITYLPSANFNALFLMRHMSSHYAAEVVSVRHLCDWLMFLKHEHQNIDFPRIYSIYKEYNMHRFVDAVNGILVDYMCLDEGILPSITRDKELENRILNDILNPEFAEKCTSKTTVGIILWKTRRYFSNRWKHKLIYNESWIWTFFQSSYSHLLKPKAIKL